MHILIVKMTSLGDVVHMLPALSEAADKVPSLRVDWVVESGFDAIPGWHPAVEEVIPIALRCWRRQWLRRETWQELRALRARLASGSYDLVLDSQGLLKSLWVARMGKAPLAGLDRDSAREPLVCLGYDQRYAAPRELHAITRNRLLTAAALRYQMSDEQGFRYGVQPPPLPHDLSLPGDYLLALHGTARPEKEYSLEQWEALIPKLALPVLLPWGNERERKRAEALAASCANARVLPRLGLAGLAGVLGRARGVVGVDTGLMHLAAAFRLPGVALYPATPPTLYGVLAEPGAPSMVNLSASAELEPGYVAEVVQGIL